MKNRENNLSYKFSADHSNHEEERACLTAQTWHPRLLHVGSTCHPSIQRRWTEAAGVGWPNPWLGRTKGWAQWTPASTCQLLKSVLHALATILPKTDMTKAINSRGGRIKTHNTLLSHSHTQALGSSCIMMPRRC